MDSDWVVRKMPAYEKAHPHFFAAVHAVGGVLLLVIVIALYSSHRAQWWTPLLVPAALGHLYAAHLLLRLAGAGHASGATA